MKLLFQSLLFSTTIISSAWGEPTDDPFAVDESLPTLAEMETFNLATNIDLTLEVYTLPLAVASEWLREDWDHERLYRKVVAGPARLEELAGILARSGQEAVLLDVAEYIFPTEFEPAEGFRNPPTLAAYEKGFVPAAPSAFDAKNLGTSLYATPQGSPGSNLVEVELMMKLSHLKKLEEWGEGATAFQFPVFGESSLKNEVVVESGKPTFLGTMSRHGSEEARWAFLTARVDRADLLEADFQSWVLRYEVFSLPILEASGMRREVSEKSLYDRVVGSLQNDFMRQEKLVCTYGAPGAVITIGQISEYIHPSDYEPPGFGYQLVNPLPKEGRRSRDFFPVPSSFDTKNLGDQLGVSGWWNKVGMLELQVDAEHVELLRRNVFGERRARTPRAEFGVQELATGILLAPGEPQLLGTVTPLEIAEEGRVWWAFVTATRN